MGCCSPKPADGDENKKMNKEDAKDAKLLEGPCPDRGCTDILFVIFWICACLVFISLAGAAYGGGNPYRLVAWRDYQGQYCKTDENWRTKAALKEFPMRLGSMKTDERIESDALTFICSTSGAMTSDEKKEAGCPEGDANSMANALANAKANAKQWADGTSESAKKVWNGDVSGMFSAGGAGETLQHVCVSTCDLKGKATRSYNYMPRPNVTWYPQWVKLVASGADMSDFKFNALPETICPYQAKYCVLFPGTEYAEFNEDCKMILATDVASNHTAAFKGAVEAAVATGFASASASFGEWIGDLMKALDTMAIVCIIAFIVSMVYMVLLRYFVGAMVWASIMLIIVLGITAGALAFSKSTQCAGDPVDYKAIKNYSAASDEDACPQGYAIESENSRKGLMGLSCACFGIIAIFTCLVIWKCKAIRVAIACNKVAADFVGDHKHALLVPIVANSCALLWFFFWCSMAVYLVSQVPDGHVPETPYLTQVEALGNSSKPGFCNNAWPSGGAFFDEFSKECEDTDDEDGAHKCWRCYAPRYLVDSRFGYQLLILFWNNALLIAIMQCTIAGAAAVWYFTPNKDKGSRFAISIGIKNSIRFHLGSLAFGSFILACVQWLQAFMYYLQQQAKVAKNPILETIFKCLGYCIACFERIVQFLTKRAYIHIAIKGCNFCTGAWDSFCLMLRNAARISALSIMGSMIEIVGAMFITVFTAFLGYQIVQAMHPDLKGYTFPVMVYIMIGYIMAKLTLGVFTLAVDSVLECFCIEEELGAGDSEFTPTALKELLPPSDKE